LNAFPNGSFEPLLTSRIGSIALERIRNIKSLNVVRTDIRHIISKVIPLDEIEANHIEFSLHWIDSGAGLFRVAKPATPDPHLVSYFLLVDGDYVLLVDHINAELWLPTGGHVEPDENPHETVVRELNEELGVNAEFLDDAPPFITVSETVGKTSGHTDVSLWFALKGSRTQKYDYDSSEFHSVRWFHHETIPFERADPNLGRYLKKLFGKH
jgi:8-oxo-dGTP diphosphatase